MEFFTLKKANRALTLIKPIVLDIKRKWNTVKALKKECDTIIEKKLGSEDILTEKEERLDTLLEEIESHILELQHIGVEFKGFDEGIIDFPVKLESRMIYLCWKVDENEVSCWHEIFEGFDGRKEVTESLLHEMNVGAKIA